MRAWFEREWLPSHGDCPLRFEDLTENPPHSLLGVARHEYLASLDRFRLSDEGRSLRPVAEVCEWFRAYGGRCRHIALTARPLDTVSPAASWVMEHFGRWIRCFGFVPSSRGDLEASAAPGSKQEWLEWVRAGDILVEDNPKNLADASSIGLRTILISQPWNNGRNSLAESLQLLTRMASIS